MRLLLAAVLLAGCIPAATADQPPGVACRAVVVVNHENGGTWDGGVVVGYGGECRVPIYDGPELVGLDFSPCCPPGFLPVGMGPEGTSIVCLEEIR